MINEECSLRL